MTWLDAVMDWAWDTGCPPATWGDKRVPQGLRAPRMEHWVRIVLPDGERQKQAPSLETAAFALMHVLVPDPEDTTS